MKYPHRWLMKRPGLILPVFFLSFLPLCGQITCREASVVSSGNSFVTRQGFFNASHNQAGLGWTTQHSISMQHARPFSLKELGISSLGAQFKTGNGSWGATISTAGIRGFRQTSVWYSYGMMLGPKVTTGIGIHYWSSSIEDRIIYQPGISCAIGIQMRLNDHLTTGAHLYHPFGWYSDLNGKDYNQMVISTGFAYTFFHSITYSFDLKANPTLNLQSCFGLELLIKDQVRLTMGMQNRPISVSGGIALNYFKLVLHFAFEYMIDTGSSPIISMSHVW